MRRPAAGHERRARPSSTTARLPAACRCCSAAVPPRFCAAAGAAVLPAAALLRCPLGCCWQHCALLQPLLCRALRPRMPPSKKLAGEETSNIFILAFTTFRVCNFNILSLKFQHFEN